ncbi:DNA (cytosine-5-)-methyltransferase [Stylosanthes scabra]|uniref:DNA (Cytosine-5-)-methyltransferase n=1 Tax=Stylosanthes scabra TaxID=79078 RepID=A0ABU6WB27_9FABA|nr:DNA (cytosine-5-)-methyltransferase [Stylosanthes scabra]
MENNVPPTQVEIFVETRQRTEGKPLDEDTLDVIGGDESGGESDSFDWNSEDKREIENFQSSSLYLIVPNGAVITGSLEAEFRAEVAGESERNERIATKPRRPLLEPMRTHHMEPCVRIQAWAARPNADLDTYAYAYEASMRTHRSIPASINRGAFHHFNGSPLPHLA